MPRSRAKPHSRKRAKSSSEYHSPLERPVTAATVIAQSQITQLDSQKAYRKTFRFTLNSGVGLTTAWTTTMMLDLYAIAAGGSATPVRIYNNMKLLGVKMWAPMASDTEVPAATTIILEYSPSLIAGFGGAPRTPHTSTTISSSKLAHICAKPSKGELASQWFTAQQGNYTLFNMQANNATIIQLDFMVVEVNGETPVTNAYTSAVAKGTVGVTNFGVAGCRSIGCQDLVNP